jgi:hypothetical protein
MLTFRIRFSPLLSKFIWFGRYFEKKWLKKVWKDSLGNRSLKKLIMVNKCLIGRYKQEIKTIKIIVSSNFIFSI